MRLRLTLIISLAFPALCATVLAQEIRSTWENQDPPQSMGLPFSLSGTREVLLACVSTLSPPRSGLLPEYEINHRVNGCEITAAKVLAAMPTHGLAHFTLALTAELQGDETQRDLHLENSVRFSPFEGWLAERRFALSAGQVEKNTRSQSLLRTDAATLLTSQSGAELVATYYIRRENMRPLVAVVAANATDHDQRRFLNLLRIKGLRP